MMIIKINNQTIQTPDGAYLFDVLREAGHDIPHLCHHEGLKPQASCMLCMVKDAQTGQLLPSCSHKVRDGLEIITEDEEIFEARKMALDLLLSDHIGDCEAPCTKACPAHMNIPLMNRKLQKGQIDEALAVVLKDIALPGVLGRICSAPCEKICRRKDIDEPVSICLLKRYAGDLGTVVPDLVEEPTASLKDKKIAVIGAGPAGLAAAYHTQLAGVSCTIFDRDPVAGGQLRAIDEEILPPKVIDREVDFIRNTGVTFQLGKEIDRETFLGLRETYNAVVIATGPMEEALETWGVQTYKSGIKVDRMTYETDIPGVFAIGAALKPHKMAIKSLAHGKEVSHCVLQYLRGEPVKGEPGIFNSRFGRILSEEVAEFLKESSDHHRVEPIYGRAKGMSLEEVMEEAARCIHCDCRKIETCKLRVYADRYQADQRRFSSEERRTVKKCFEHGQALYEPAKCIKCGICVGLSMQHREEQYGMTYIGRGFDIEIGIPFHEELTVDEIEAFVQACPTGALSLARGR